MASATLYSGNVEDGDGWNAHMHRIRIACRRIRMARPDDDGGGGRLRLVLHKITDIG